MPFPVSPSRELRRQLGEAFEQVRRGELGPHEAKALAMLSTAIIDAARYDLELFEAAIEHGDIQLEPIIGDITGPPQTLAITKRDDTLILRERIVEVLSSRGPMKPRTLATELGAESEKVQQALDHEWFERTPLGYRMAESNA